MEIAYWTAAGLGAAIVGAYACSALAVGCARTKPHKARAEAAPASSTANDSSHAASQNKRAEPARDVVSEDTFAVLKGHTSGIVGIAWSPDGKWLASTSGDRTLRLWATDTLQAKAPLVRRININLDTPLQLLFTTDGKLLMSFESGRLRRMVPLSERAADGSWVRVEAEFDLGHKDFPRAIVPIPQGVLSCGGSTVIHLHSHSGAEIATHNTHQVELYGLAASADGHYVAAASWSADVNVTALELSPGKPTRFTPAFALPGHRRAVRAVAFAPNRAVTCSADGTARLYRLRRPGEDPVLIASVPASNGATFHLAAFSPEGSSLLLAENGSLVQVNAEDGTVVRRWVAHGSNVAVASWSADAKLIASAGEAERNVKIWRA